MNWPPDDGLAFIQSRHFDGLILEQIEELMDEGCSPSHDAIAQVYAGLDRRLHLQPAYLNGFVSFADFRGFLKAMLSELAEQCAARRNRGREIRPLADGSLP